MISSATASDAVYDYNLSGLNPCVNNHCFVNIHRTYAHVIMWVIGKI
jgi:hypothetical protein